MSITLLPKSMLSFPNWNIPSFLNEDEWGSVSAVQNGLTVSEDKNNFYVEAAIPGVDPKNIEISFDKGILWIKGEAKEEEKDKKYYRKAERSFSYRIVLPGDIHKTKEPDAVCKDGVVKVTFGKADKVEPKRITVRT